jgi:hypothetical protein
MRKLIANKDLNGHMNPIEVRYGDGGDKIVALQQITGASVARTADVNDLNWHELEKSRG